MHLAPKTPGCSRDRDGRRIYCRRRYGYALRIEDARIAESQNGWRHGKQPCSRNSTNEDAMIFVSLQERHLLAIVARARVAVGTCPSDQSPRNISQPARSFPHFTLD